MRAPDGRGGGLGIYSFDGVMPKGGSGWLRSRPKRVLLIMFSGYYADPWRGTTGADEARSQGNPGNSAKPAEHGRSAVEALTLMATLAILERQGVLHRYETDLERDEQPERLLYCTQGFLGWFEDVLPSLVKDRGTLKPYEQVDRALREFVTGRPLAYDQGLKVLNPVTHGVWELKTIDVRIFGWFAARNTFVAVNGAMRSTLVPASRYTPFIDEARHVRDSLDLDELKFLSGGALRNVL